MEHEKFEMRQKFLICQLVSEIPPKPPLKKGGQGGFMTGSW
jgi:hypothetical protein